MSGKQSNLHPTDLESTPKPDTKVVGEAVIKPPLIADTPPLLNAAAEAHESQPTSFGSNKPSTPSSDSLNEDQPDPEITLLFAEIHELNNKFWREYSSIGVAEGTSSEYEEPTVEPATEPEQPVQEEAETIQAAPTPVEADCDVGPMLREFVSPAGHVFRVREQDWTEATKHGLTNVPLCNEYGQYIEPDSNQPRTKTTLRLSYAQTYTQSLAKVLPLPVVGPPSEMPGGTGDHHAGTTSAPEMNVPEEQPPRALVPLTERGRAHLLEERHLDLATLDAFSHGLRESLQGVSVAPHGEAGDGEEAGPAGISFYGRAADEPGRGPSLWFAVPENGEPLPQHLVVAESFIDALSVWEMIPADAQPHMGLASIAGVISAATQDLLERSLVRMVELHQASTGITPILLDVTHADEITSPACTVWLSDLAKRAGAEYRREVPSYMVKDWNEELKLVKADAREAQETVAAAESDAARLLIAPDEPEKPVQGGQKVRPRGR